MENKTYTEKLKDPRWQKLRLKVFERDKFKCTLCNDHTKTLHVHHEKYIGLTWEAPIRDLKTVCVHCHCAIEMLKKECVSISASKKYEYTKGAELLVVITKSDVFLFFVIQGDELMNELCLSRNLLKIILKEF